MSLSIFRRPLAAFATASALSAYCLPFCTLEASTGGTAPEEKKQEQQAEPPPLKLEKPAKDDGILARQRALDLAGAFSNDGYKLRDGFWFFPLGPTTAKLLSVHLFANNEYWFSGASAYPGTPLKIEIFDAAGKPVSQQIFAGDGVAAAGCVPKTSGTHFVSVSAEGEHPTPFCLVYSYK